MIRNLKILNQVVSEDTSPKIIKMFQKVALDPSTSFAGIEGIKQIKAVTSKSSYEKLAFKVGCLLMASIGITNKRCFNIPFSVLVITSFIYVFISVPLISVNRVSVILTSTRSFIHLITWCILFKKRKNIYRVTLSFLKTDGETGSNKFSYLPWYMVGSIFLFPSLFYIAMIISMFFKGDKFLIQLTMHAFYPDYENQYLGVLMVLEIASFHIRTSASFIVAFLYTLNCILAYERTVEISKMASPAEAVFTLRSQVLRVRAIEKAFSLPIFLVFAKISMQLLFTVLYISFYDQTMTKVMLGVITGQSVSMFLLIVLVADLLQSRCERNLETVFFGTKELETVGSLFDGMKLTKWNRLTIWNMLSINRHLALTVIGSTITYGVLVVQMKT